MGEGKVRSRSGGANGKAADSIGWNSAFQQEYGFGKYWLMD